MGCASPKRFFSGICLGPASRQPCLSSPKPLSSPKHRRDQSSPRLAFAARANSLRHRPTRAGTKLSLRGWLCQMTPRSLSGLENGFPYPSWTSSSHQGKIIGDAHTWVPGGSQDLGLKDARKAAVVTAKPPLTDSEFPAPGGTRNRSGLVSACAAGRLNYHFKI